MSKSPRRKLKIGTIDDFHHFWYLLIWIVYLSLFYLAEHLVTKNYWVLFAQPDIDGGLVGGASLKADFGKIVNYK